MLVPSTASNIEPMTMTSNRDAAILLFDLHSKEVRIRFAGTKDQKRREEDQNSCTIQSLYSSSSCGVVDD